MPKLVKRKYKKNLKENSEDINILRFYTTLRFYINVILEYHSEESQSVEEYQSEKPYDRYRTDTLWYLSYVSL